VPAAVAGAAFIASSSTLTELADVEPATAAAFRAAYALPVLWVLATVERRRLGPRPRRDRLLAAASGVFLACDLVLWHHSIPLVGAGLATVLGNLQVFFVGLAAWWLLGERPSRRFAIGAPVVLAGVVLLSGAVGGGAYGRDPVRGVLFGVGCSIAYAGFILVLRASSGRGVAGPLADATLATALTSTALGPVAGGIDLVPHWPSAGWLILLALSAQVLGWLFIGYSLPRLPAALTALVLLLQPAGALGLAAVALGERPSPVQLAGCVVVLGGVLYGARSRGPSGGGSVSAGDAEVSSVSSEPVPEPARSAR
jgi:drug/metabolite transporter (DMT)-like permease